MSTTTTTKTKTVSATSGIKKMTPQIKGQGTRLWNSIKSEVYFTEQFGLTGEHKYKSDLYLAELKKRVWHISLRKGNKQEALAQVYKYNAAINDLLAELFEPKRSDLDINVPIPTGAFNYVSTPIGGVIVAKC